MKKLLLAVGAFAFSSGNGGTAKARPKPPPPALIPAQVTDLRATALSDSAVVLQWTEVSSGSTAVPRYVVRFDSLVKFDWGSDTDVVGGGCAAPILSTRSVGKPRACVLTGLAPNVAYAFQMVAYTGTLNTTAVFGPLSNVARATTAQRVGPILMWRPRLFQDTLSVNGIVTPFGTWQFNAHLHFGDYVGTFTDSLGQTVGRGYLLVTKP